MMNLDEAVEHACDEANDVLDTFVYMAIWEVEVADARCAQNGVYTTCFRLAFEAVTKEWQRRKALANVAT